MKPETQSCFFEEYQQPNKLLGNVSKKKETLKLSNQNEE
jgi:hypothetical protein